jgi:hypothetical protein
MIESYPTWAKLVLEYQQFAQLHPYQTILMVACFLAFTCGRNGDDGKDCDCKCKGKNF